MPAVTGYTRRQIALHWIVAALILMQYLFKDGIASAWEGWRSGAAATFNLAVAAHIVGGGLILAFAIWRLALRRRDGVPAITGDSRVQVALARVTHAGLYLAMILLPVSGAVAWFGGVETAAAGHNVLKVVLLALIALHVVGALYHQFVLRDGLLARMRSARI